MDPGCTVAGDATLDVEAPGAVDDTVADIDAEADAGAAGAALRHDLNTPGAVESDAHGGRTGRSQRHGGQRRDRRDGDDGIAIEHGVPPETDVCASIRRVRSTVPSGHPAQRFTVRKKIDWEGTVSALPLP